MSEFAPPDEPGDLAGARQETLTPQAIDALLADFRAWLEAVKEEGGRMKDEPGGHPSSFILHPSGEPLDLHTLLGQFVALRHEVNLQTKASRAQQEQTAEALGHLGEALAALEKEPAPAPAAPPSDDKVRPLLKTLVDLHDNLSLARREVQRVQDVLNPFLDQFADEEARAEHERSQDGVPSTQYSVLSTPPASSRRSLWSRWFGGRQLESTPPPRALLDELTSLREQLSARQKQLQALGAWQAQTRQAAERTRQFVTSLITGYTMSLQRVERALQQHGLETIPTIGEPFDPEIMEVLEVVHEAGRTTTEVIDEVRRGYFWRGQVFRFAQVRVARPSTS